MLKLTPYIPMNTTPQSLNPAEPQSKAEGCCWRFQLPSRPGECFPSGRRLAEKKRPAQKDARVLEP